MTPRQLIDNNLVVTGGIIADNITASEALTAKVAQFLKVKADQVDVNELWANTAWLTKANAQVLTLLSNTDGSGYTSTVTGQGLLVTYTAPDGTVQDVIKLGTFGEDRFALYRDGMATIAFDSGGNGAFKSLEASDSFRYKGEELAATIERVGAGVYNYGDFDYGAFGGTGQIEVGSLKFMGVASVDYITAGNRMTRVTFTTPTISFPATGGESRWDIKWRITDADDTSAITEANSATFDSFIRPNPAPGAWHDHTFIIHRPISAADAGKRVQILVMAYCGPAGNQSYFRLFQKGNIVVDDAGALPSSPSVVKNAGGGAQWASATTTKPAPAPTVSKTRWAKEWSFTQVRSYLGSGGIYNYNPGKGYQGLQFGTSNGNLGSMFLFPDFAPYISGSTIDKIEVTMKFDHWYYGDGGIARIHLHSYLNGLPATFDADFSHAESGWGINSTRTFRIPSQHHAGFLSGAYRGIGLRGDGTPRTYGFASVCKIKITYTK